MREKTMIFQKNEHVEKKQKIQNLEGTRSLAIDFSQTSRLACMKLKYLSSCTTSLMEIAGKSKKISQFFYQKKYK